MSDVFFQFAMQQSFCMFALTLKLLLFDNLIWTLLGRISVNFLVSYFLYFFLMPKFLCQMSIICHLTTLYFHKKTLKVVGYGWKIKSLWRKKLRYFFYAHTVESIFLAFLKFAHLSLPMERESFLLMLNIKGRIRHYMHELLLNRTIYNSLLSCH